MSVNFNQYIFFGVKLPYENQDDDSYEKFEPYIDNCYKKEITGHNDISCIYDGMNGHYIMLGRIILKGEMDVPFCDEPFKIPELDYLTKIAVAGDIRKNFPDVNVTPFDVKAYVLTHVG